MLRCLAKPEIRVGPGCNWSPNFQCITVRGIFEVQCITVRGIFEVVYVLWRLKLVITGMG